jgi:nucleotide-binding universal stress UspA family protein
MFKHILIPVDLADTAAAAKAVEAAKHIARRDGSRISVISVVPAWPDDLAKSPHDYQPDFDAYVETLRAGASSRWSRTRRST